MHAGVGPAIELAEASKRYGARGGTPALDAVSLQIPAGACWAVVGPNGAGKSTLFGLILGFLHATSGSVQVDGEAPRRYARRRGFAHLPERFTAPQQWTVREAVRAFARLDGAAASAADAQIERWGLAPHADKELGELSHGLLQRVGLAQAFAAERDIMLLDEPTEGLDPLWRLELRAQIAALRARGCTVLIASHDLVEVERSAERAVLLENGRIRDVLETRPAATPTRYRIEIAAGHGIDEFFPSAQASESSLQYDVVVADAAELSARLAALIAGGGVVVSVTPDRQPLEERVHRALREGDA